MKLLLAAVNAKYIHSNPAVYSLRRYAEHAFARGGAEREDTPARKPGVEDLPERSANAPKPTRRTDGTAIEIAEFTINQQADDILREIFLRAPQVLAFSCYIWNLDMIERLLADLPKILPDTDIWLGGPEVSYETAEFLEKHPQVRGVMVGEGEETFAELAAWYAAGEREGSREPENLPGAAFRRTSREQENLSGAAFRGTSREPEGLPGIVFRSAAGEIIQNPPRALLNLDRIPFPYSDLNDFENRIIYYESSRGCPFSCSYCLSSIDRSTRFRSLELVKRELQFFLDRRAAQVKFVDRTFNCRHSHAMEIWRYIREHDNGMTNFHFEIAADLLKEEELALLATMRPGLMQLEIGVQSTNRQTLREIERVSDLTRLFDVVTRLQAGGNIHLHLDLIAGLPYEGYESFVRSFNEVYALHPQQLQLGFLKVLKGAKMRQKADDYGLCYRARPMYEVLYTRWISYEQLLSLKAVEEMVEIYYNSGQFARTIRYLEHKFPHPFALFEELAHYSAKHGAAGQKQSRMARFEMLRAFAQDGGNGSVCDELLTLDVYLREKSKSRPSWAEDPTPRKARILEFYRREREQLHLLDGYDGYSPKQMMHMTHLEHFNHQVLQNGESGECWLLFDYRRRDPLTGNAAVLDVTEYLCYCSLP